jgi:hypothetical protein
VTTSLPERDVNAINASFKRTICQAIHDLAYGRAQRPNPRPMWRSAVLWIVAIGVVTNRLDAGTLFNVLRGS